MTASERIARARRVVALGVATRLVLTGTGAAAATVLLASFADLALGLAAGARALVPWLAGVLAIVVMAPIAWKARRMASDQSMALWIEEQQPLDYLLVTAADNPDDATVIAALAPVDVSRSVRRASVRGTRDSALLTAGLVLILAALPDASVRRVLSPRPGDILDRPSGAVRSRLDALVVQYAPPAYIGGGSVTLENPESVRGVEGGTVEVRGIGVPTGLVVTTGGRSREPGAVGTGWRTELVMPSVPSVLRITEGDESRLIALEPIRDSLPTVTLHSPAHDTLVRVATGRLELKAHLADDFGLAEASFEYVISSGSGELFQFRSGRIGSRELGAGSRTDSIQGVVALDTLQLRPGDVMHLRAVARDHGPRPRGAGSSDTRTYRVLRQSELDTAQVIALPSLPGDTAALSQRLLIQMTEALEARRPRLRPTVLQEESRAISRDQRSLRRQVADVIFLRLSGETSAEEVEGMEADSAMTPEELLAAAEAATGQGDTAALDFAEDESPVVAINRPLLEAYNAMWDATRALDVAALTEALPHMYTALDAIQRARAAERVYLRAPVQRAVVNLAQVRLSGRRDGIVTAGRTGGQAGRRKEWLSRLLRAVEQTEALRDSLLILRIEMLADEPVAAAALNEAITAIRSGRDHQPALNSARMALVQPPDRPSARPPSPWGGAW